MSWNWNCFLWQDWYTSLYHEKLNWILNFNSVFHFCQRSCISFSKMLSTVSVLFPKNEANFCSNFNKLSPTILFHRFGLFYNFAQCCQTICDKRKQGQGQKDWTFTCCWINFVNFHQSYIFCSSTKKLDSTNMEFLYNAKDWSDRVWDEGHTTPCPIEQAEGTCSCLLCWANLTNLKYSCSSSAFKLGQAWAVITAACTYLLPLLGVQVIQHSVW